MKRLFDKVPWLQQIGCGVLICALLLSICLPLMGMRAAEPENPILQAAPQEITVLQAGQGRGSSGNGETESQKSEGSGGSKTDETQQGEQEQPDPEETENQTEQGQDTQPEQQPQGKPHQEVLAEAAIGTDTDSNQGDEGEEIGETGEEDETLPLPDLDLGAVLTWYKYGSQASSMVCAPEKSVGKRVLLAQLDNGKLRYDVELSGLDADDAEITGVQIAAGNGVPRDADTRGAIEMELPDGAEYQNYILSVSAHAVQKDQNGETVETNVEFTFILRLESGIDLDLQLTWQPNGQATCGANATVNRTVKSDTLTDGLFVYNLEFLGASADDAQIKSASYWSSADSGILDMSGEIQMNVPDGQDTERYFLAVTAEVLGQTIDYTFVITYEDGLDLQLQFTWYEKSVTAQQLLCDANQRAALSVKHNQLNGGELLYKLDLKGRSADDARITSASCNGADISPTDGSIQLQASESGASYTVLVTAEVSGKTVTFTITIRYQSDVALEMAYTVMEDGSAKACQLTCENKKSVRAEDVYDDQLTSGLLSYELRLTGEDTAGIEITSVTCYQSGNFSTKTLSAPTGSVTLLLAEDGKTGENTFTVKANGAGEEYTFTISIPYKHRGDQEVQIECDLEGVVSVASGQPLDFKVRAWSEDAEHNRTYITSTGLGTTLSVKLDGEACRFTGVASGNWQQYKVSELKTPDEGDTIEYELVIIAEDAYGNKGEKTITLLGKYAGDGQKLGEATIVIDMGIVGLGSTSVTCDVLAGEPASCTVAKAVWGYDAGEPFGTAERSLGWSAECNDPLGVSFYLASLDDGSGLGRSANALSGSWSRTEEENFSMIDAQFGEGTNLDILWRCIYRNGLNLKSASTGLGEQDFTQGSGWEYEINGSYPGVGMDAMNLQQGDVLTLRYTLAYGWDIGNGQGSLGNAVGYCVTYYGNGSWSGVNHDTEEVTEDGVTKTVCRRCGLASEGGLCSHPEDHRKYVDQGDGTCAQVCEDCNQVVGEAEPHVLKYTGENNSEKHTITCEHNCGYEEEKAHELKEADEQDEATKPTCTRNGVLVYVCKDCGATVEKELEALGHEADRWSIDKDNPAKHYQKCNRCNEIIGEAQDHDYQQSGSFWKCDDCGAYHGRTVCRNFNFEYSGEHTDRTHTLTCPNCGLSVTQTHDSAGENGSCSVCGYGATEEHVCEEHVSQFYDDGDGVHHSGTCTECGKTVTERHTFVDGVCTVCGAVEEQEREHDCAIDGHDYVDGYCRYCGAEDPDHSSGGGSGGEDSGESGGGSGGDGEDTGGSGGGDTGDTGGGTEESGETGGENSSEDTGEF